MLAKDVAPEQSLSAVCAGYMPEGGSEGEEDEHSSKGRSLWCCSPSVLPCSLPGLRLQNVMPERS